MGEAHLLVSPAKVFARPTAEQTWLGPAQQAALSQLSRNTRARLLVGPPSSGKSTLLNYLASQLARDCVVLHCRGPKDDAASVLASLLLSADLAPWDLSTIEQRNLLTVLLQQRRSQGRRVVLAIDDAHTFEDTAWEEVERLLALKIDRKPAVEGLLCGPPALVGRLDPARTEVDPDSVSVHTLTAPKQSELMSYVEWRLSRFEMMDLITPAASQTIARLSGGRYAAVNVLCQISLLLLRQLSLQRVDARVARQALATLVARQGAKLESTGLSKGDEPSDNPPQGYLLISRGGKVSSRVSLGQRTLLGRSEHNDVCLPSPYLSRHHAVIIGTPEGYYVVDLNSVNGVLLNGNTVARAVLCDQDILGVGPFRLKVQIPDWIAHDDPFTDAYALVDTAVMPPPPQSTMRRIK